MKTMWWLIIVALVFHVVEGSAQAIALFVFGDSLVDNGNNNFLSSIAKSNYYPYGVDFNGGPTGRFSNGKTFVDYLGDLLGVPSPPPFADPTTYGTRILGGVNYASAAAGILDETGQHYGQRYSLNQQVINFETTLGQLRKMMSGADLSRYLAKSIALVVIGSNDYINNYLLPSMYPSSYNYRPPRICQPSSQSLRSTTCGTVQRGAKEICATWNSTPWMHPKPTSHWTGPSRKMC
ncbi:GDSL esterase/lipase [Abeliophyllum distichum]|uniref:GDSL esterase/lipase n=1 Tax=Abeliophyllum distichum TaxID=126358 RepID=A0ABD1RPK9_9LAMI